ncbi:MULTISPECIES: 6-hydroxymethylpterin diphosphokinase MptE-like protein [unclassified Methanosarcina]|uniref:6-hydroxymethylpterin diphosphokinase MptE-like protein n=1 Tax=unclassified Methanosarcina TaxID=2644672 RepID=UPI0006157ABC|nr:MULTISPECIES: 6-hydroxymethylpterin diphosphokinase MptE-like protein [unclassified Methanosarcina]AKB18172.1 6-hydroxymethyl-7,8-dihydropterin pyrophosphokinase [Methanosarcina sp. WWM596]AKB21504.1 6-hydroxymethyl-7,8-dihydropterin pyrophosphokinase [Methanosarcina sp. WH1]
MIHTDFAAWEPIYERILEDFGFDRTGDEEAARFLSQKLTVKNTVELSELKDMISGKPVLVCGNAPGLRNELLRLDLSAFVIIAADGAAAILMELERVPEVICTDLDGNSEADIEKEILACSRGSIVLIHAHGDNRDKLKKYVPRFTSFIATTQARPFDRVYNFGGFSDGDRCVFIAREFGAKSIKLAGFDFEDPLVNPIKKKKLNWAKELIGMLGI